MRELLLAPDLYWLGALDPDLRVFDIIMQTEFGTTYNSYLLLGSEKIAVVETVKHRFFDGYRETLAAILQRHGKNFTDIDYIVVNHTEPDHAGSVEMLIDLCPRAQVVGSAIAIDYLRDITNNHNFSALPVRQGDKLSLGNRTLEFIDAPFLHWPDSIFTWCPELSVLFTCDSYGSHYSFDGILLSKLPPDRRADYQSALLYYYTCIFGPFKKYVLSGIAQIENLPFTMICPGHGPVLDENPRQIVETYRRWSTIAPPDKAGKKVVIVYCAAYGYTGQLAAAIADAIRAAGGFDVITYEVNAANYAQLKDEILAEIQWADGILFGTPTINGDALPPIWDLTLSLSPVVHAGKTASAFGAVGWSGEGVPNIISRLDQLRMGVLDGFTVKFRPDAAKLAQAAEFGRKFAQAVATGIIPPRAEKEVVEDFTTMNPTGAVITWKCLVCNEKFDGVTPPLICPACGAKQDMFEPARPEHPPFRSDKPLEIIIVGNGAAGISAAEAARARNAMANIEIISSEKYPAYYRPSLSDYIAGEITADQLLFRPAEWYEQNNIRQTLGVAVMTVDCQAKKVELSDSSWRHYDKLIVASGAKCNLPPIQNSNFRNVYTLRGRNDAEQILQAVGQCRQAVVIGGGVLGLETAWSLKESGLTVTVIELADRILPRQLDREGSRLFEQIMKDAGIILFKHTSVKKILGDGRAAGVELEDGTTVNADVVIVSAGINPNKQLLSECGVRANRGVVVDDHMRTSIPDIYAAGDVAEYDGMVIGLWSPALEQGTVAGANAAGDDISYTPIIHPLNFSGINTEVMSIGNVVSEDDHLDIIRAVNPRKKTYLKLVFDDDRLVGAIAIGDISKGAILIKGVRNRHAKKTVLRALSM
ncbi:MAG: FAD-dependent oxidoreductase [Negativicutes bacterium]|nr:FAD-dependent oxidoreductase [Negativicutes bacterium]